MDEETQKRQPCGLICICPQRIYVTGKPFVEQYNSYCNFFPKNLSKQNKTENNLKKHPRTKTNRHEASFFKVGGGAGGGADSPKNS